MTNLLWIHPNVWDSSNSLEEMSKDVEQGDVDDCLELSEKLVRDPCSKNGCKVAKARECMVDGCGLVLTIFECCIKS